MSNPLRRHLDSGNYTSSDGTSPGSPAPSPERINRIGPLSPPPDYCNSDTSLESLEKSAGGSSIASSSQTILTKKRTPKAAAQTDIQLYSTVTARSRMAITKFQAKIRGYITRRLLYILLPITSTDYLSKKASGYDIILTVLKSCAIVRKIFIQMLMCNMLMEGYTEGVDVKLSLDEREKAFFTAINGCTISKKDIENVIESDRLKYERDMSQIHSSAVTNNETTLNEELLQLTNSYKAIAQLNTVRLKDIEMKTKSVLKKEFKAIITIISGYNYKTKRLRTKLDLIDANTRGRSNKYRRYFETGKQYLRIKTKFCYFDSILKARLSALVSDLQKALKEQDEALLRLDSTYDAASVLDSPFLIRGADAVSPTCMPLDVYSDTSDLAYDARDPQLSPSIRGLRALKMSKLEEARDERNRALRSPKGCDGNSSDGTELTDDSESMYSGTDYTNESGDNTYFAPLSPEGRSPGPTPKVDRELLLSMMVRKGSNTKGGSMSTPTNAKGSKMQDLIDEYKAREEERRAVMMEEHLRIEALKASLDNDDSYLGNFTFNIFELMPTIPAVGQMAADTAAAVRGGLVDSMVGSINEGVGTMHKYTVEPVVDTINETAGAVRTYTVDPMVETAGTVSRYTFQPVVGTLSDSVDAIVQPLYPSGLISGLSSSVADWTGTAVAFPSAVFSAAVAATATSAPSGFGKEGSPTVNGKRKSKKNIITQASPLEYDDILELNKV